MMRTEENRKYNSRHDAHCIRFLPRNSLPFGRMKIGKVSQTREKENMR